MYIYIYNIYIYDTYIYYIYMYDHIWDFNCFWDMEVSKYGGIT